MAPEPKIIYKDENFLILEKSAGLLVHEVLGKKTKEPTLVGWLLKNFPQVKNVGDAPGGERPGIVHRLDKTTSGLMVVALNQKTFQELKRQFGQREIKKTYLALVWGKLKNKKGEINLHLEKSIREKSFAKRKIVLKRSLKSKEAITRYQVVKEFDNFSLLKVEPLTGRTHQIRVHLAAIGHPVVGDRFYGKKPSELNRPFLHAFSLRFSLFGSAFYFENPLANDLEKFLNKL